MIWIRSLVMAGLVLFCSATVGTSGSRERGPWERVRVPVIEQEAVTEEYLLDLFDQDPEEFHQLQINESNKQDNAVSWSGAIGRCQVLLSTARGLFGPWVTAEDLKDSTFNIFTSLVELNRLDSVWSKRGYKGDALKLLKYSSYYQGERGVKDDGLIVNYSQAIIEGKTRPRTYYEVHMEESVSLRQALRRLN